MKNIQIIDNATNCTFSLFQATEDQFALLFPDIGQDVQFNSSLEHLPHQDEVCAALDNLWQRPVRKRDAMGIHGTIFYGLEHYRDVFPGKCEDSVDPFAINPAQRRLFSR